MVEMSTGNPHCIWMSNLTVEKCPLASYIAFGRTLLMAEKCPLVIFILFG